jgi:Sugar efflux transporter for intercellular exchange
VNVAGLAVAVVYIVIYLLYSKGAARATAFKYLLVLAAIFAVTQGLIIGLSKTNDAATESLGIFCVVFNVLLFASPMASMKRAIDERNVAYIPMLLTFAGLGCGIVWGAYGVLKSNWFVYGPNGAGIVLSSIQLLVALWIHNSKAAGKYATVLQQEEEATRKTSPAGADDDNGGDFEKSEVSRRRGGVSLATGGATANSDYSPLSSTGRAVDPV